MIGKLAVMEEPGIIEYQGYDLPTPEKGALLVKVVRTNVCASELHIWHGDHPVVKDGVLGNEMVGKTEKIGERVTTDHSGQPIRFGDRISTTYFQACGS